MDDSSATSPHAYPFSCIASYLGQCVRIAKEPLADCQLERKPQSVTTFLGPAVGKLRELLDEVIATSLLFGDRSAA